VFGGTVGRQGSFSADIRLGDDFPLPRHILPDDIGKLLRCRPAGIEALRRQAPSDFLI
jgi:hypothetical protein